MKFVAIAALMSLSEVSGRKLVQLHNGHTNVWNYLVQVKTEDAGAGAKKDDKKEDDKKAAEKKEDVKKEGEKQKEELKKEVKKAKEDVKEHAKKEVKKAADKKAKDKSAAGAGKLIMSLNLVATFATLYYL